MSVPFQTNYFKQKFTITKGKPWFAFCNFINKKSINTLSETIFLNLPTEVLWRAECE